MQASVVRAAHRGTVRASHALFALCGAGADRLYLLADVLPLALAACALRGAAQAAGVQPLFDAETTTSFTQAALFVIAIVLSGVLQEYGEAERLPAELACELLAASAKLQLTAATAAAAAAGGWPGGVSSASLHGELLAVADVTFARLGRLADDGELAAVLDAAAQHVAAAVHAAGGAVSAESVLAHFDSLRSLLMRLGVIQRVDFIDAGYTLMDMLVFSSLAMTVACEYKSPIAAHVTIFLSTLMLLYIKHLVHDIDEPFSYLPDHLLPTLERVHQTDEERELGLAQLPYLDVDLHGHGRAEIDLYPLCNAYATLAQRAGVDMALPAVAAAPSGLHAARFPLPSTVLASVGAPTRRAARNEFLARLRAEMAAKFRASANSRADDSSGRNEAASKKTL